MHSLLPDVLDAWLARFSLFRTSERVSHPREKSAAPRAAQKSLYILSFSLDMYTHNAILLAVVVRGAIEGGAFCGAPGVHNSRKTEGERCRWCYKGAVCVRWQKWLRELRRCLIEYCCKPRTRVGWEVEVKSFVMLASIEFVYKQWCFCVNNALIIIYIFLYMCKSTEICDETSNVLLKIFFSSIPSGSGFSRCL